MRKIVKAIIDNAARCPYYGYSNNGLFELFIRLCKVPHRANCYNPAETLPNHVRKCSCKYDKETGKYLILEGCPLETEIDEVTIRAVLKQQDLKQQGFKEAAEPEGEEAA